MSAFMSPFFREDRPSHPATWNFVTK